MTLDEAIIKHIQIADSYHKAMPNYDEAADHRQLAEWLTELKGLKRNPFTMIQTVCTSVAWCIDCKYSGVCPMQDRDCEKPCEWKSTKG